MAQSMLFALALAAGAVLPQVDTTTVATGLKHPWSMAFLPGGDFLVSEKEGGFVRVTADGTKFPIAGMPSDIDNVRQTRADNSGLFDVVLHPDFLQNRRLYFSYASKDPTGSTTRLSTALLVDDGLVDIQVLFDATPRSGERFHYGGGLLIDRHRRLYLTVGERHYHERDNPPMPAAQDPASRHGKIYRFTLDGQPAAGNPDFGADAVPGLYATGIRAAQGLAQASDSDRIWMSEHGPVGGDEINILRPRANYGWPVKTAGVYRDREYNPQSLPGAIYTAPAWIWKDRTVAPTGLTVYSGSQFPQWRGDLIMTGLGSGHLMRVDLDGERVVGVDYLIGGTRFRNVKQAADGNLYALTDEPEGRILRLERKASTEISPTR
ncbi:PQQ-dependent sugar dehydrogenase [Lysobacter sp. CA199]|uniref:PQQ-dependent sugar dehydrogenase n=1 Tax=Lysobacter sp. CA199 TaxID=3455608 RepID=UPI003F8D467C